MRKIYFPVIVFLLFLIPSGIVRPRSVFAADGGPAGKLMLSAAPGPGSSEVTLSWKDADSADNYHLVYGTDSKNMQYGALNIGRVNRYTVGKLNPGTRYYFSLVPVFNNLALYTSERVSAVSTEGSQGVQTSVQATTTNITEGKHMLVAGTGMREGEVVLSWRHMDDANNYHLVYGTSPGKYQYGVLNIGWVNGFTVRHLVPGATYYFALVPVKNDRALYTTREVSAAAKANIEVVQTTAEIVTQTNITQQPASPSVSETPEAVIPSTDSAVPTVPVVN